jgi:hypothetical protein
MVTQRGLTGAEILRIVNTYIGVDGGYLIGFSYAKVAEFFTLYCEVDVNPDDLDGTSRERFIRVFQNASPRDHVNILRGLLEKVPEPTAEGPLVMSADDIRKLISRLEGLPVPPMVPMNARDVVERALADSEALLKQQGPVSAVDRTHTSLHGYLMALCDDESIPYKRDDTIQRLLRLLAEDHPAFSVRDSKVDITRVLQAMGTILDTVNAARDNRTPVHPNEVLIREPEAMLAINAVRSIMHYLNEKIP